MGKLHTKTLIDSFKLTEGYLFTLSLNIQPKPVCSKCGCRLHVGQEVTLYEYNHKHLLLKHIGCLP